MNENFKRQYYFKASIVYLLALSYPMYSLNNKVFLLVLFLMIFVGVLIVLIILDYRFYRRDYNNLVDWLFYRLSPPWLQLFVMAVILLIILGIVEPTYLNEYLPLIVFFCWIIPLLMVTAIIRNIYSLVMKIREMASVDDLFGFRIVFFSFITLIVAFFAPDLAFGLGYQVFFLTFYKIDLGLWDVYYLSMIITNTLPVDEPFSNYIKTIGENVYMSTFQVFNVFISKLINWIVIGLILNYLFLVINNRRNSRV
ncbi:hypothetical protein ACVNNN_01505 [Lysinibacillus fusiformis]